MRSAFIHVDTLFAACGNGTFGYGDEIGFAYMDPISAWTIFRCSYVEVLECEVVAATNF